MALARKAMPSPNYSSRGGAAVRLIVIHTAEGARTIEELGNFFANSSSGVSSHVGIDDTPGVIGEYVRRDYKAWTQGNANPVAVSAELCAFAAWDAADWDNHYEMLRNCADWIAEEAKAFGIPLTKLTPAQAQGTGRGVCQHADLGSWGGGHWDCGSSFPLDEVLAMANAEESEVDEMGYPAWTWDWISWSLTTDKDPDKRPKNAPEKIPDWAWDALNEVETIGKRYGTTDGERQWVEWYLGGKKGERPNVPETIPERWWTDEKWVQEQRKL